LLLARAISIFFSLSLSFYLSLSLSLSLSHRSYLIAHARCMAVMKYTHRARIDIGFQTLILIAAGHKCGGGRGNAKEKTNKSK
jgi:hypothetical protein